MITVKEEYRFGSAWAANPEPVTDGLLFAAVFGVSVGAQNAQAFDPFESPDITEGTGLTFAGQGAVNIPLGDMLSAQLDGQTELYDRGGDEHGEIWNWGAGAKLRLADSMPIYCTADYRGGIYQIDEAGLDEITEHTFLVGLAFAFGAPCLMENDRRGATLSTPMLPARAAAWTEALE